MPGNSCAADDNDDIFECTICLTEIDDGEKVLFEIVGCKKKYVSTLSS